MDEVEKHYNALVNLFPKGYESLDFRKAVEDFIGNTDLLFIRAKEEIEAAPLFKPLLPTIPLDPSNPTDNEIHKLLCSAVIFYRMAQSSYRGKRNGIGALTSDAKGRCNYIMEVPIGVVKTSLGTNLMLQAKAFVGAMVFTSIPITARTHRPISEIDIFDDNGGD